MELIVVSGVISILAAIAIPQYKNYINSAKITVAKSSLDLIKKALEVNAGDRQRGYPTTIDFSTCVDGDGAVIFERLLCDQIKRDFFAIDSYLASDGMYTLKVRAKDTNHTPLTLTLEATTVGN